MARAPPSRAGLAHRVVLGLGVRAAMAADASAKTAPLTAMELTLPTSSALRQQHVQTDVSI